VAYKDISGRLWTYGDVLHDEAWRSCHAGDGDHVGISRRVVQASCLLPAGVLARRREWKAVSERLEPIVIRSTSRSTRRSSMLQQPSTQARAGRPPVAGGTPALRGGGQCVPPHTASGIIFARPSQMSCVARRAPGSRFFLIKRAPVLDERCQCITVTRPRSSVAAPQCRPSMMRR